MPVIMSQIIESSSDEDDTYTNSVARLRALKKQRFEKLIKQTPIIASVEVATNGEKVMEIKTRSTNCKSRRRNRYKSNAIVRTKERHPPVDLDCDVEIVSIEKNPLIIESCEDNIVLSSDDEACSEDDNYEMTIKVLWRSTRLDRLNIRRNDNFLTIFQHYADLEKVSVNEILIMKKDRIINCTDTPVSLQLSVIDILDGGIVNPGMKAEDKGNDVDNDACSIKIQTANKKQSLIIPLKKDQEFKVLFAKCAEQLDLNENNLKFYFDGEQIEPTDTPQSLDLEGEACIDLHISLSK